MLIEFSKYQGLGTDYIILDNRNGRYDHLSASQIARLCERRFGIGAEGLIRLNPSAQKAFWDAEVFDASGLKAGFNGICAACVKAFADEIDTKKTHVQINERPVAVDILSQHHNQFFVKLVLDENLKINKTFQYFVLEYDYIHCFYIADDLEKVKIENSKTSLKSRYPEGANMTFFQIEPEGLYVRHFDRILCRETYTSSISAVGAALSYSLTNPENQVLVKTKGGEIQVFFEKENDIFSQINWQFLVQKVYQGQYHF